MDCKYGIKPQACCDLERANAALRAQVEEQAAEIAQRRKAGQSAHNNSVRMGQYILEAKTEKRLREAAEERVRELEAQLDSKDREGRATL